MKSIFVALVFVQALTVHADDLFNITIRTNGFESSEIQVGKLSKNVTPGCYIFSRDGGIQYGPKWKNTGIEAQRVGNDLSFSLDVGPEGFCRYRPEYVSIDLIDSNKITTRLVLNVVKKDPKRDQRETWIPVQEARSVDCSREAEIKYLCEVVTESERLEMSEVELYLNRKSKSRDIEINWSLR